MAIDKAPRKLLWGMLAVLLGSCAPLQPTNPAGPRSSEPPYPLIIAEDNARKESATAALNRLRQSAAPAGTHQIVSEVDSHLAPITSTIASLPAVTGNGFYLPKVGIEPMMNEEETRESLRRFIKDWRELIGADPADLSLVDHSTLPDGTHQANYEQRPFRFPIRGKYGKLQIRFASDRRILSLASTCIPDPDRVRNALRTLGASGAVGTRLTAEDAIKKLRDQNLSPAGVTATPATLKLPASADLKPRELVTFIQAAKSGANALEIYVAWEIEVSNAPFKLVYIDSINGDLIAAE